MQLQSPVMDLSANANMHVCKLFEVIVLLLKKKIYLQLIIGAGT